MYPRDRKRRLLGRSRTRPARTQRLIRRQSVARLARKTRGVAQQRQLFDRRARDRRLEAIELDQRICLDKTAPPGKRGRFG
jgi:hypothetical protein